MIDEISVPLMRPRLPSAQDLVPYLAQIDSNRIYTNFGPLNRLLEDRVAAWFKNRFDTQVSVVSTSSATTGLELMLQAARLPAGSKVLVPALTFVATCTVVQRLGFRPVACDIDPTTLLMTPDSISSVDLSGVAAAIPVATFGVTQSTTEWEEWSLSTGVKVIIDAAAAFGAQKISERVPAVFSLHATKPLGSAEGGLCVMQGAWDHVGVRSLSNFGLPFGGPGVGTNAKLSEYHAAIALAAFDKWAQNVSLRRALLERYFELISLEVGPEYLVPALQTVYCPSVFLIRLRDAAHRSTCERFFTDRGIGWRRWYTPLISDHPALKNVVDAGSLRNATEASEQLIGVPFYLDMSDDKMARVVAALKAATRS